MVKRHLVVIAIYSILAIVMTWPLALNFASAIPGIGGDAASYVWALGWAKTALDLHLNPFHTDYVYYPLGGATQLLWAVSLLGFVSIPLQALVGLLAAHNVLYLAATVLTAYGTFLLAQYVVVESSRVPRVPPPDADTPLSPFAALLVTQFVVQNRRLAARRPLLAPLTAGLVFAFAPLRLGYGLAFLNLFNTELVPFYLLFLLRATREPSWRDVLLAGVFLGLNAYIDFQIAAFLILLTALYAAYWMVELALSGSRDRASKERKANGSEVRALSRRLGRALDIVRTPAITLVPIALVSLVIAIPILGAVAQDFSIEGGNYIRVYKLDYSDARAYDLLSFFIPNARSTLYANAPLKVANVNSAVRSEDETVLSPDRQAFLGYVVLAVAAYAVFRRWRAARFWLITAALFALFSLGPWLHVGGQATGIPLPYLALHEIPIVNHIRIPMRYGLVVFLALAMLVALGMWRLSTSRWRWVTLIVPLAILAEYAVLPYPMQAISIPKVYDEIARAPGNSTLLEIPSYYWRWASVTELYQPIHGKRILRGYTNRIAPDVAEYFAFRGTPIVDRSLRVLEGQEKGELAPEDIAEDQRVRDQVIAFFGLRYAVVHRDMLTTDQAQRIDTYVRDVLGGTVISDDGTTVGYVLPRVDAPDNVSIDLRENIGQMYAGRGWQFQYPPANWDGSFNFVWARGADSEIYFAVKDAGARVLALHAYADTPQQVTVLLNGQRVGALDMASEWRDYSVSLPAGVLVAGMNRVQLDYGKEMQETIGVTTIQIINR